MAQNVKAWQSKLSAHGALDQASPSKSKQIDQKQKSWDSKLSGVGAELRVHRKQDKLDKGLQIIPRSLMPPHKERAADYRIWTNLFGKSYFLEIMKSLTLLHSTSSAAPCCT